MSTRSSPTTIVRAVIWLRVSVPVLSEQITVVEPSVSTECEPLHDGVALGHPGDADGQGDGDDRRQALGDGGDGQGDGAEHGVGEVGALDHLQHEHQADGDAGDHGQALAEAVELALQRGRPRLGGAEQLGDLAHLGAHAGRGDDAARPGPG